MRFLKPILILFTFCILAACQSTTAPQQVSRTADIRHVGVFVPQQSPTVDRIAAGKVAKDYFMPLWRAYESGRVEGAKDIVTVYLYRNGDRPWSRTVAINGYAKFTVSRHLIDSATSLCVEVPWKHIAHQKKAPNPRIMCADGVNAYMAAGRGKSAIDAYAVVATKPAG